MLNIPFLTKFIQKTVKRQKVADSVDYLNYYVSSIMFAFFALAISAKQYFGSPIQCWVPSEFRGGWEKYAEDYCFIANSYYVPFEEEIPVDVEHRKDHISYYRWVPIMLALQAIMFFIPNWIWNMLHKQTAINPREFLKEAEKVRFAVGEKRDKEVESLANFFMETVSVFQPDVRGRVKSRKMVGWDTFPVGLSMITMWSQQLHRIIILRPLINYLDIFNTQSERFTIRCRYTKPRSGYNATLLYLLTKAAYVTNICLQIVILNHFLGQNYLHWGYEMTSNIVQGHEWKETEVFPRVIMCDFQIRRLANLQRHTVQCVIMMNMINEKLYLFLYFWMFFLLIATIVNFIYFAIVMAIPPLRSKLILFNIDTDRNRGMAQCELKRFVKECLHPDGVLLLQFVREHVGGRVAYDLVNKLFEQFSENDNSSNHSMKKQPLSSPIEKYSRPPHFLGFPARQSSNQGYFPVSSAPMLEDYMDHGTMRIGEKVDPQADHSSRRSPTDV